MEKRLLDLDSLMSVMIGSLSSSFTIAFWWPIAFAAAKLSIINDAPSLPWHKGQFAGANICCPRQLGR
jgi:hypothetical protein